MEQANDFLNECERLHALLSGLPEGELSRETKFKAWTIEDIVRHLAVWDRAARVTLEDSDAFAQFFAPVAGHMASGTLRVFERDQLPVRGQDLKAFWWENCQQTARAYATTDPKQRVAWGGPGMSARTCITSRLMETWSHSQAIYDELGLDRDDGDWIRNIVQIGVQTFEWSFRNRGLTPPGPMPNLLLQSPNGSIWRWDHSQSSEQIAGTASEFCQVVSQVRNIKDTNLQTNGPVGAAWMAIAQCFAGPPADPPKRGQRFKNLDRATGQAGAD